VNNNAGKIGNFEIEDDDANEAEAPAAAGGGGLTLGAPTFGGGLGRGGPLGALAEGSEEEESDDDETPARQTPERVTAAMVPQAFSHFTYEKTEGKKMVVDLQGVWDAKSRRILLTDPCILSANNADRRYGRTDRGRVGMAAFFSSYQDTPLSRRLGFVDGATREAEVIALDMRARRNAKDRAEAERVVAQAMVDDAERMEKKRADERVAAEKARVKAEKRLLAKAKREAELEELRIEAAERKEKQVDRRMLRGATAVFHGIVVVIGFFYAAIVVAWNFSRRMPRLKFDGRRLVPEKILAFKYRRDPEWSDLRRGLHLAWQTVSVILAALLYGVFQVTALPHFDGDYFSGITGYVYVDNALVVCACYAFIVSFAGVVEISFRGLMQTRVVSSDDRTPLAPEYDDETPSVPTRIAAIARRRFAQPITLGIFAYRVTYLVPIYFEVLSGFILRLFSRSPTELILTLLCFYAVYVVGLFLYMVERRITTDKKTYVPDHFQTTKGLFRGGAEGAAARGRARGTAVRVLAVVAGIYALGRLARYAGFAQRRPEVLCAPTVLPWSEHGGFARWVDAVAADDFDLAVAVERTGEACRREKPTRSTAYWWYDVSRVLLSREEFVAAELAVGFTLERMATGTNAEERKGMRNLRMMAHLQLARIKYGLGDRDGAMDSATKATTLVESDPRPWQWMFTVHATEGLCALNRTDGGGLEENAWGLPQDVNGLVPVAFRAAFDGFDCSTATEVDAIRSFELAAVALVTAQERDQKMRQVTTEVAATPSIDVHKEHLFVLVSVFLDASSDALLPDDVAAEVAIAAAKFAVAAAGANAIGADAWSEMRKAAELPAVQSLVSDEKTAQQIVRNWAEQQARYHGGMAGLQANDAFAGVTLPAIEIMNDVIAAVNATTEDIAREHAAASLVGIPASDPASSHGIGDELAHELNDVCRIVNSLFARDVKLGEAVTFGEDVTHQTPTHEVSATLDDEVVGDGLDLEKHASEYVELVVERDSHKYQQGGRVLPRDKVKQNLLAFYSSAFKLVANKLADVLSGPEFADATAIEL